MTNLERATIINNEIQKVALTKVNQEAKDDFKKLMETSKNPVETLKHSYKMVCNMYKVECKKELLEL